jgi:hypothetical protein
MGKFLNPSDLKANLYRIFKEAEEEIIIISPFIQLSDELKVLLKPKQKIQDFRITILYGKNEKDPTKSLNPSDYAFFNQFPNHEIFYNANLHAKYYANESESIITSLNLHQFSLKNNIEVGTLLKKSLIPMGGFLTGTEDADAFNYFDVVLSKSEPVHIAEKESRHKSSKVIVNNVNDFFNDRKTSGYCIRSGEKIPFNLEKPFSAKAYLEWAKYKNESYKENYCHFSGEKSNGQTSFAKPVLAKYWKEVKG